MLLSVNCGGSRLDQHPVLVDIDQRVLVKRGKQHSEIRPIGQFLQVHLLEAAVKLGWISSSRLNQLGPTDQSGRRLVTSAQATEIFQSRMAEAETFAKAKKTFEEALEGFEAATAGLKHSN